MNNDPDGGTTQPPSSPPNEDAKRPANWMRRSIVVSAAATAAALAIILARFIYRLPYPTRAYLALAVGAGTLILAGLAFLIILIPAGSKYLKSDVRTEHYSVRAAYLCVITGLILFGIIAIGLVFSQVAQAVWRH